MRLALIFLPIIILALASGSSLAEKNAVLVIVDGLGASYVYPELSASCADGTPLGKSELGVLSDASARYTLRVPVPKTEYGHAVIVTGYSAADDETVAYYDATIFDSLRKEGYLCIGVMETGDSANMVAELDAVVHDENNSPVSPDIKFALNSEAVPAGARAILTSNPPVSARGIQAQAPDYCQYDDWSLIKAAQLVQYLNSSDPGQKYLLVVNVAGTDEASHASGYRSYSKAVTGLDPGLSALAKTCRESGAILVVTADHGMSFKTPSSKGSHSSGDVADRNESRLIPFLIFSDTGVQPVSEVYGQECIAPTLLSLMDCPQYLSMCDGAALPWNDRVALQMEAARPASVTITGPDLTKTVSVNGTLRVSGLERGDYEIGYAGHLQSVHLDRDTIVRLTDTAPEQSGSPALWLFLGAVALSAAGIAAALYRQR